MELKRKFSHVDLMPIQFTEINSYLSKSHNWKSPGNYQIQNYSLKDFPSTHSHITRKHQRNNGGTGEGTCLADQMSNLFDNKIRRQQGSQKLLARYIHNDHVKNPNRNKNQKNLHTFGRADFTTSIAKRM